MSSLDELAVRRKGTQEDEQKAHTILVKLLNIAETPRPIHTRPRYSSLHRVQRDVHGSCQPYLTVVLRPGVRIRFALAEVGAHLSEVGKNTTRGDNIGQSTRSVETGMTSSTVWSTVTVAHRFSSTSKAGY